MRPSTFIIRLASLCLLLVSPAILGAQGITWRYAGVPEGGNIASLVSSARGNLYAITSSGHLFNSTDGGERWRASSWSIARRGVTGLYAMPDGNLFAFVGGRALYRSTDEGSTWLELATDHMLHGRLARDSSGALITVDVKGTLRSTDAGESWTLVEQAPTDILTGIATGPGGIDYLLRTAGYDHGRGYLQRSFDRGLTWSYMDTAASPLRYTCLAVSPRGTVFLGTMQDGVIRSTDRGETWWYVTGGDSVDPYITDISVLRDGEIVALSGSQILRSTDDGVTWRRVQTSLGAAAIAIPTTVAAPAARELLVGTADAGVLRIDGAGSPQEPETVTIANRGLLGLGVYLLAVRSSSILFAVSGGRLYRSTDGGAAWTDLFRDVSAWSYPPVITREGALLISLKAGNLEGILRSTDNGDSWDTVVSSLIVTRVAAAPDGRLYMGSMDGLYRSTDDGRTWSRFGPAADTLIASSFLFEAGGDVLVGTVKGAIYRVSQGTGGSTLLQELGAGQIRDLTAARGMLYAMTAARGLRRSTDGGATWESFNDGSQPSSSGIFCAQPDGTFWTVSAGSIFRSVDGGEVWTPANDGLRSTNARMIEIGPDGEPWVGTDDGIYTLAAPALVPAAARRATASVLIHGIHPVPSHGRGTVEIGMERDSDIRLRLFDVGGREIRTLLERHMDAGSHAVEIDLSGLPDGTYLLRLDAGEESVTRMIPVMSASAE